MFTPCGQHSAWHQEGPIFSSHAPSISPCLPYDICCYQCLASTCLLPFKALSQASCLPLWITQWGGQGRYGYTHFRDEDIGVQRGEVISPGFLCQGCSGYFVPQWAVRTQRDRSLRPCPGGAGCSWFPARLHHCGGLRRREDFEQRVFSVPYCPLSPRAGVGAAPKHMEIGVGILIEGGPEGLGDRGRTHLLKWGEGALQSSKDKVRAHSSPPSPALSPKPDPENQA